MYICHALAEVECVSNDSIVTVGSQNNVKASDMPGMLTGNELTHMCTGHGKARSNAICRHMHADVHAAKMCLSQAHMQR